MPATLKEIALKANVSPRAVSAVVNNDFSHVRVGKEKQERIRKLVAKMKYTPNQMARALVTNKTNIINMVISRAGFFETAYNARFSSGLQEYLLDYGYHLHFSNLEQGSDTDFKSISQPSADAVLFFYYGGGWGDDLIESYLPFNLPLLAVRGKCDHPEIGNLYPDIFSAMYNLTKRIIEMGHTRIAHIATYLSDSYHRDGHTGIRKAVEDHGIDSFSIIKPDFNAYNPDSAGRAVEIGQKGLEQALGLKEKPTVLIFNHDMAALTAIDRAKAMGIRVPEEFSVCGSGNDPVGRIFGSPSLTSVESRAREAGARAGALLLQMIGTKGFIPKEKMQVNPVFRNSIADIS